MKTPEQLTETITKLQALRAQLENEGAKDDWAPDHLFRSWVRADAQVRALMWALYEDFTGRWIEGEEEGTRS